MILQHLSRSRGFQVTIVGIIALLVAIWAIPHFFTKVVYLNAYKYSKLSHEGDAITYHSNSSEAKDVVVTDFPDRKELLIEDKMYTVREVRGKDDPTFLISYPNGGTYTAVRHSGIFLVYDDQGDMVSQVTIYVDDKRVLSPNEEVYLPSQLVTLAYTQYQSFNGSIFGFMGSIALFLYGWCGFRYEAFQRFMFTLSYGLWVKDPEPSDFYFAVTKFAACIIMVCAIGLGLKSL